jgi:purine nucleosidase
MLARGAIHVRQSSMAPTSLIIDCDPGVDDAIALFLAFASPEALDLLAITTVAGNVSVELTTRNARIIREIAAREDVPIFAGATQPLVRQPVLAAEFHGKTGLGALEIFEPRALAANGHAAGAIIDAVMNRPAGSVNLAITGPMTNLALALKEEPKLARRLGAVTAMGGASSEGGNITPYAEYNIHADPHAAAAVFASDCRVVMLGLDATHQVLTTPARLAALKAIDTPVGRAAFGLLDFSAKVERNLKGRTGAPMHDPCTIAWLLAPQLFSAAPIDLSVVTDDGPRQGHTAIDFHPGDPARAKVQWVTRADADGFFDLLLERLAR